MAKPKVADLLVDVLAQGGVRQIYGVSGDSSSERFSTGAATKSSISRKPTRFVDLG